MHNPALVLVGALLVAVVGCSDDTATDPATDGCVRSVECGAARVCRDGTCVDVEDGDTGRDAGDAGDDTDGRDAVDTDPGNNGADDAGDMGGNNGSPDGGDTADTPDTADVADVPDVEEDVPEDVPLEPRPEVLEGGISVYEAGIHQIRNFIVFRRGNAGAVFAEPTDPPPPIRVVEGCDVVAVGGEDPAPPFGYDAGLIRITTDSEEFTLTPTVGDGGDVQYRSSLDASFDDVYPSSGMIEVRSTGGRHIRGFEAMITAPRDHLMDDPLPDDRVARGVALPVEWSPSGTDLGVVVTVAPLSDTYAPIVGQGISCAVPSDGGSFSIPAAAMAEITSAPRLAVVVLKVKNITFDAGDDTFVLNVTAASGNFVLY